MDNKTILIVEDEVNLQKIYRDLFLEHYGNLRILTANNGAEAYDIIKREKIDLMTLDQFMPRMTGLELLAKIKEEKGSFEFPIVVVSAYLNEFGEKFKDEKKIHYLTKPADEDQLMDLVDKYLTLSLI